MVVPGIFRLSHTTPFDGWSVDETETWPFWRVIAPGQLFSICFPRLSASELLFISLSNIWPSRSMNARPLEGLSYSRNLF